MAYPKYNPIDVDMSIYPKRWLDVAPVSFEDALKQAQQLENQDTVNDINEQNLEDKKRDNEYESELGTTVQERLAAKQAAGEEEKLSTEEILDIANSVGFKYGKGKEIADRELRRSEAEANRALAERKLDRPLIRTISANGGLVEIDPDSGQLVNTIREPKASAKDEDDSEVVLKNPETGGSAKLNKKDPDYAEAYAMAVGNGFTVKIKNAGEMSEKEFQDMMSDKELFGTGKKSPPKETNTDKSASATLPDKRTFALDAKKRGLSKEEAEAEWASLGGK